MTWSRNFQTSYLGIMFHTCFFSSQLQCGVRVTSCNFISYFAVISQCFAINGVRIDSPFLDWPGPKLYIFVLFRRLLTYSPTTPNDVPGTPVTTSQSTKTPPQMGLRLCILPLRYLSAHPMCHEPALTARDRLQFFNHLP